MADSQKYTAGETLCRVLNAGEDALKVDIDNVTLITEGSDINIEVHTDKAEDSMMMWTHTVKTGTGGTSYVPLIDADGHLQVDTLSSALPSGAATSAKQDIMITALQLIDNAVDGNYLNVNANIAGTDFVGGAGAVAAGVQRVTLASDDPAAVSLGNLDNAVDGNFLNVNLNVAGTDMAANAGTMSAQTPRVTIATDDTHFGAVGAASDVDGVVHGQLRYIGAGVDTLETTLSNIETAIQILDDWDDSNYANVNANIAGTDIVGGAGAVASGVQRVTLASDDPGVAKLGEIETTNNANQVLLGTIDSDTDAIKTATESSASHLGNMFYDTALAVTPSDGSDLTGEPFFAVYVGTGGDLKVDMADGGSPVTLANVASGQLLPIMVERIYATGTGASNIIVFK